MDVVESCTENYVKLDMEYSQLLIMDTKAARAATQEILTMHYIPHDRSEDLRNNNDSGS